MIKLPEGWKDMIQVRDWMSPISSYGEVALLVFALKNKDGQIWTYQENNQDYPLTGGAFSSLETSATKGTIATDEEKSAVLKQMYDRMVYHIPAISVLQDKVIRYDKDGEHYEDVTNDEWEEFKLEGLTPYKESV